jgi:tRNA-specific 2-thiouridylase
LKQTVTMPRAVALFSGGLDSMLAVRILQEQGFEVEALNVRTVFECCQRRAARGAAQLGARLTVLSVADDYVELIRSPRYGYGKGVNPCIDCRIYMCTMAKRFMEEAGACVVITGEVLGQRPMSQRRWQLEAIERTSGLDGRLLRPLSAKLLPPTMPEREGLIDREKLYDFNGRGRRRLIALGRQLGIREVPQPSTGCALTEVTFAPRVRDLMTFHPEAARWDFELLSVGRHLRFDAHTKVVVGRNAEENAMLEGFFERADAPEAARLHPEGFLGPDVLVLGKVTDEAIEFAGALVLRFSRRFDPEDAHVRVTHLGASRLVQVRVTGAAASVPLL